MPSLWQLVLNVRLRIKKKPKLRGDLGWTQPRRLAPTPRQANADGTIQGVPSDMMRHVLMKKSYRQ